MRIGIIGLVTIAIVALFGCSSKFDGGVAPKIHAPLLSSLKDPESAQFRNERLTASGALCGEVNSKNSFGGYLGFKHYILAGPGANYIEDAGVLGIWSAKDTQLRDQEETAIRLHILKYNDENRGLPLAMPSDAERREFANKKFFEAKWANLCGDAKA